MKPGVFQLAAQLQPEPLIVPIALANFDLRLRHTTLVAMIKEPIQISDLVDVNDKTALQKFLIEFQSIYRDYVLEAQTLAKQCGPARQGLDEQREFSFIGVNKSNVA